MINPYYVKDFAGINQIKKSFDSSYKHVLSEHPLSPTVQPLYL